MSQANLESRFKGRVTHCARDNGALAQCIESEGTGLGIPDVYVAHSNFVGWIEVKYVAEVFPKAFKRFIKFRPAQPGWLKSNIQHGGKSYVMIGFRDRVVLQNFSDLIVTSGKSKTLYYVNPNIGVFDSVSKAIDFLLGN